MYSEFSDGNDEWWSFNVENDPSWSVEIEDFYGRTCLPETSPKCIDIACRNELSTDGTGRIRGDVIVRVDEATHKMIVQLWKEVNPHRPKMTIRKGGSERMKLSDLGPLATFGTHGNYVHWDFFTYSRSNIYRRGNINGQADWKETGF